MSTVPVPVATARAAGRTSVGLRRAASHALTVAKRNLLHLPRNPQLLVFTAFQPIMFVVLFAYVFGGAIQVPGVDYIDFLIPGIVVQTVAFGTGSTSVGMAEDLTKGIVDRFRSLPIARSAVLAGRVLADTVRIAFVIVLMVVVGTLIGFRFSAGVPAALGFFVLALAFGFAMSWIAVNIGLKVRSPEAAQSAGFVWLFPLTFASSAFVPVGSMPGWLQAFAERNPITVMVNALRALTLGGPTATHVVPALLWIAAIFAVFAPLAVRQYRRLS